MESCLVRARLDRALASPSWSCLFPSSHVLHMPAISSDHNPLLLETTPARRKGLEVSRWKIGGSIWTGSPSLGKDWLKEKILRSHLEDLYLKLEVYWKQRSKVSWLKVGDRNTKFFHIYATTRKRRNSISQLKLDNGTITHQLAAIKKAFTMYFKKLFTSTNSPSLNNVCSNLIGSLPQIPTSEAESLNEIPSEEEIKVVFSDGLNFHLSLGHLEA
ncbi:uncharacterized protein [Typha latifolia]|uniref:uncharacterized protein n=1 Tax=Typha latifolia TaxID=4733 RepID=UPI003C2C659C